MEMKLLTIQQRGEFSTMLVQNGQDCRIIPVGIREMEEFISALAEEVPQSLEELYKITAQIDICKHAYHCMRRHRELRILESMCIYEEISYC